MYLFYKTEIVPNDSNLTIEDIDSEYFWYHHGIKPDSKYELMDYCSYVETAVKKIKNGQELAEKEKKAYSLFIEDGPVLEVNAEGKINIVDGRHRMAAYKEAGKSFPLTAKGYINVPMIDINKSPAQTMELFNSLFTNISKKPNTLIATWNERIEEILYELDLDYTKTIGYGNNDLVLIDVSGKNIDSFISNFKGQKFFGSEEKLQGDFYAR